MRLKCRNDALLTVVQITQPRPLDLKALRQHAKPFDSSDSRSLVMLSHSTVLDPCQFIVTFYTITISGSPAFSHGDCKPWNPARPICPTWCLHICRNADGTTSGGGNSFSDNGLESDFFPQFFPSKCRRLEKIDFWKRTHQRI